MEKEINVICEECGNKFKTRIDTKLNIEKAHCSACKKETNIRVSGSITVKEKKND